VMDRSLKRQDPLRKRNNLELSWLEPVVANAGRPRRNFAVRIDVGKGTAAAPIGVRFSPSSFNAGALGAAGG